MKRLTIIFSVLLVLAFGGTLAFVAASPDFTEPVSLAAKGEDPNAPVWDMSMDDLIDYLEENGFWDRSNMSVISAGVGTKAFGYNAAEIYWWDLDNLVEGSTEAAAYQNMLDGDPIDLWGQGTMFMIVEKNGPFALSYAHYNGDTDALLAAFRAFGQNGGAAADAPVWDMSLEELVSYLDEKGLIDASDKLELGTPDSKREIVWRFNGADLYWWDLDNLKEGDTVYEEYREFAENGMKVYEYSGVTVVLEINGPFGLYYADYEGKDVQALIAAFQAFGRE